MQTLYSMLKFPLISTAQSRLNTSAVFYYHLHLAAIPLQPTTNVQALSQSALHCIELGPGIPQKQQRSMAILMLPYL